MNREMERIRAGYLERLRFSLGGSTDDVSDEIVREIEAHIDDALAARRDADVSAVLDVLDRLGAPEAYAPDLALYMMVDRGYRQWSVPHMFRSTTFWALRTLVGAMVVSIFGALFVIAGAITLLGVWELLGFGAIPETLVLGWAGVPAIIVFTGLLMLVGLLVTVRWFIGQYVSGAQPGYWGAVEAANGRDWVGETSRRIVAVAVAATVLALVGALITGVLSLRDPAALFSPRVLATPGGILFILGVALGLVSPVVGLLWSLWDGRGRP